MEECEQLKILTPGVELPPVEHFNISENGVSNGRIIDGHFRPDGVWCDYCQARDCRHIRFALAVPKIREIIEKKRLEGWKLPETE